MFSSPGLSTTWPGLGQNFPMHFLLSSRPLGDIKWIALLKAIDYMSQSSKGPINMRAVDN